MVAIRIRDTESCERQPQLAWDTIWVQRLDASGGYGDWILAGPRDQFESRGGLRAEAGLHTATLLQLFTDARAPSEAVLPAADGDRRGWWGDSIRIDGEPELPLGSLIWLHVERGRLDETTAQRVRDAAADALDVLRTQGAVARTEITTDLRIDQGFLGLIVEHYSHDGSQMYAQQFGVLWDQAARGAQMNFGDQGVFANAV